MSDYNPELITELINGRLSPDERRAALARIGADPELQSEYETQLVVASLLNEAPSPTMTAAERSGLHTALRQQLHLDDAPVPIAVAPSRWQRWWAPIAGLAAAAAVVIGAVVILPGSGTDDSVQFAAAEVTSTVQSSRVDEADVGDSAGSADGASEEQTTTTAAASEELTPAAAPQDTIAGTLEAAEEPSSKSLPHLPDVDLEQLGLAYAAGADDFEAQLNDAAAESDAVAPSDVSACLDETGDSADAATLTIVATATVAGVDVVVLSVAPPTEDPYLIALDVDTCRELASTRP